MEEQTSFINRTTSHIKSHQQFLNSDEGQILYNSTCLCLLTIGETIFQIDTDTKGKLFAHYSKIAWNGFIRISNIISHEYLSVDPELVFSIVQEELPPLLDTLHQVISDLDAGKHDQDIKP